MEAVKVFHDEDIERRVAEEPFDAVVAMPANVTQTHGNNAVVTYTNASLLHITDEEQKKLQESVDPNEVEIRPDGLLYLPQVFVRDKLNTAFGIGQWALLQHAITQIDSTLCFDGSLYVRGAFVARAMGEAKYIQSNEQQTWASVYESAKSDCLVRCCKDLGIAKELWQPAFGRDWQAKYAVKVWREKVKGGCYQWRRKDVAPFYDEKQKQEKKEAAPTIPGQPDSRPAIVSPPHGPGDFICPIGTPKGKPVRDMTDKQRELAIAWCEKKGTHLEFLTALRAFAENPTEMTLDKPSKAEAFSKDIAAATTPIELKNLSNRITESLFEKGVTAEEANKLLADCDHKLNRLSVK